MCCDCPVVEMNEQGGVESWAGYGPPDPRAFDMARKPNTYERVGDETFKFYGYIGSNRNGIVGWYGYRLDGNPVNFYLKDHCPDHPGCYLIENSVGETK